MLKIEGIRKKFDGNAVLSDISFEVRRNEVTALSGANGSGKTTLLKIIGGLIIADSGAITLDDRELKSSDISLVFEGTRNFYWPLSVKENFLYFAALKGIESKELKIRISELSLGKDLIMDFWRKPYGKLSTGQKQIMAVLLALLVRSPLILLDEPTNGLDVDNEELLISVIRMAAKDCCFIISTHDEKFIEKCADKVILIKNGRLCQEDM